MEKEEWGTIDSHQNYMISTYGRVYSKPRFLINSNGIKRFWKGRFLEIDVNDYGYESIVLDHVGCWIHKLVAMAFIPNPNSKRCINHLDGNKRNNVISNLEWATHRENMAHGVAMGLFNNSIGANQHCSKLCENDVREIRKALSKYDRSIASIARDFGVTPLVIASIRDGKTWSHVSGQVDPISDDGRVRIDGFDGYYSDGNGRIWSKKWGSWRMLRVINGYVILFVNGKRLRIRISEIVCGKFSKAIVVRD